MGRILIVDDDPIFRMVLADILDNEGHDMLMAEDLGRAMATARHGDVDLVFLDVRLPDGNGLDLLPRMRNLPSRPEVIIVTGVGDPDGAVLAMQNGAWDYVDKAENPQKLRLACHRALEYRRTKLAAGPVKRGGIVGRSPGTMRCLDQLAQAAASTANVLLLGETGTGKELFARALHANSARAGGNFVIVDCASLHESIMGAELFGYRKGAFTGADADKSGLVRMAHGGTLFLDEVSELAPDMQKAFLRVLELHSYRPLGHDREEQSDFRLVCASNRDLAGLVASGGFREDLLYRIQAMTVALPPLRERREDIQELADYHLARITRRGSLPRKALSMDLLMLFKDYPWQGNVRELVNVLEALVAAAPLERTLRPMHLPGELRVQFVRRGKGGTGSASPGQAGPTDEGVPPWKAYRRKAVDEMERSYLARLMVEAGHDVRRAMDLSGLSQARLYGLLKKHGFTGSSS